MAATSEIPASSQKDPCFQLNLNSSLRKPPVAALNYNCATLQKVALKQITVKEEVSVSDGTVSAIYQKKPSSTTGSCSVPSPFEPIQELDSLKKSGKPSKEQLVDGCQGIPMKLHDGWLHPLLAHEAALEKSLKPINGQLVNGCSSITIEMQDGCFGPLPIELTQELAPLEKSGKANKGKMVNERSGISAKMQNVCLGPLPIEPIQELADLEKSGKPSKGQLVDGRSDVPTIVQDGYKDHLPIELTQELLSLEKSGKPTQMQLVDGGSGIPAKMGDLSCPKFASANNILGSRSSLEDSPEVCLEYPTNSSESCDLNRSLKLVDIVVGGFDGSCNEQEGHGMQVNGGLTSQSSANQYQSAPVCVNCRSLCVEAKESFLTAAAHGSESVSNTGGSVKVSGQNGNLAGSGKSSICSTGSDVSDESSSSSFSGSMSKPHKANDSRWEAIQAIRLRDGALGMNHFRLLKRLGCGDIGSVYLSELSGTRSYFAMKVMDKDALASRKKLLRAQTEREILQSLDHPFLPTLYTHFETEKFSCLVMEFCPGGDLHVLRQRQPGKHFSEHAAKFYVAEVLLSLEYLHMLGIIYRDLKPENVLVRDDGHIMLSDFDLSLRCAVSPTLVRSSNTDRDVSRNLEYCVQPSCIEPTCAIQPSCIQPTCFAPRFLSSRSKKEERKAKPKDEFLVRPLPELIAEPTSARSMSFVGTHEYLAPEIIKGEGHGSAVDWWTFGIFLYELLFGRTPFKGSGNRATLFNVVGQPLRFPESPTVSFAAKELIRGLLVKEPQQRLAYRRGATEVKQHPFFQSVNWALIRCASPPEIPKPFELNFPSRVAPKASSSETVAGVDVKPSGNYLDIDFF